MKKKIFAALAAALMLGMTLAAPVSAAEAEYQMGDVNLDGTVDVADAQLVLVDYVELFCGKKGVLTDIQRQIGNVDGESHMSNIPLPNIPAVELFADAAYSQKILEYYVEHMVNPNVKWEDVLGCHPELVEAVRDYLKNHEIVFDEKVVEGKAKPKLIKAKAQLKKSA